VSVNFKRKTHVTSSKNPAAEPVNKKSSSLPNDADPRAFRTRRDPFSWKLERERAARFRSAEPALGRSCCEERTPGRYHCLGGGAALRERVNIVQWRVTRPLIRVAAPRSRLACGAHRPPGDPQRDDVSLRVRNAPLAPLAQGAGGGGIGDGVSTPPRSGTRDSIVPSNEMPSNGSPIAAVWQSRQPRPPLIPPAPPCD
jgi:hypothetical protein